MSFAKRDIEDAVRKWALGVVAIPWIFANQDGYRPARPYGTILITVPAALGHDVVEITDGGIDTDGFFTVNETIIGQRIVRASINVLGDCAMNALERLRASGGRPSTRLESGGACLAFQTASDIRDLSVEVSNSWEERAQADFDFAMAYRDTLNIPAIHSVQVTSTQLGVDVTPEVTA